MLHKAVSLNKPYERPSWTSSVRIASPLCTLEDGGGALLLLAWYGCKRLARNGHGFTLHPLAGSEWIPVRCSTPRFVWALCARFVRQWESVHSSCNIIPEINIYNVTLVLTCRNGVDKAQTADSALDDPSPSMSLPTRKRSAEPGPIREKPVRDRPLPSVSMATAMAALSHVAICLKTPKKTAQLLISNIHRHYCTTLERYAKTVHNKNIGVHVTSNDDRSPSRPFVCPFRGCCTCPGAKLRGPGGCIETTQHVM